MYQRGISQNPVHYLMLLLGGPVGRDNQGGFALGGAGIGLGQGGHRYPAIAVGVDYLCQRTYLIRDQESYLAPTRSAPRVADWQGRID